LAPRMLPSPQVGHGLAITALVTIPRRPCSDDHSVVVLRVPLASARRCFRRCLCPLTTTALPLPLRIAPTPPVAAESTVGTLPGRRRIDRRAPRQPAQRGEAAIDVHPDLNRPAVS
jgi:hypothetical protein